MYMIIYPSFVLLIKAGKKILVRNIYLTAIFAFIMGLLVGNLVDLPFLLFSKEVTMAYIIIGFQTTLAQGCVAFLSVLLLYEPLACLLNKLIEKGEVYV